MKKSTEFLWQSATTGKGWGRACEHGICCKATSWRLGGRRQGFDDASESWSRACMTNWHLLRFGDNFERPAKNFFSRWLRRDLNKEAIVLLTRHARTPSTWGHLWDFLHLVWSKQSLGQLDVTCAARFFISYFVHKATSLWSTLRLFSCFVFFQYPLFCVFCQNSNSFLFFVSPQGFLKRTRSWRRAKIFSTRRFGNFLSFRICFMHCVSIRQGVLRRLWLRWSPTRRCWRGRWRWRRSRWTSTRTSACLSEQSSSSTWRPSWTAKSCLTAEQSVCLIKIKTLRLYWTFTLTFHTSCSWLATRDVQHHLEADRSNFKINLSSQSWNQMNSPCRIPCAWLWSIQLFVIMYRPRIQVPVSSCDGAWSWRSPGLRTGRGVVPWPLDPPKSRSRINPLDCWGLETGARRTACGLKCKGLKLETPASTWTLANRARKMACSAVRVITSLLMDW